MRPCRQLVEQEITDRVWKRVELKRILEVIEYESLAVEIEENLREDREVREAGLAMMQELVRKRLEKLDELKKIWKKKMAYHQYNPCRGSKHSATASDQDVISE